MIKLNLGRIGPFLSDRILFNEEQEPGGLAFKVVDSFWDWLVRIISWIYAPSQYTEENRKSVACFKNYLVDQLGAERLARINSRYGLQFEEDGSPLLSRDIAKILVGISDVKISDVEELIVRAKENRWLAWAPHHVQAQLVQVANFEDLSPELFKQVVDLLAKPFGAHNLVEPLLFIPTTGTPTEFFARYQFDSFLADRERMELGRENPTDPFETFVHNFAARIIKREMDVGMLIPAPNGVGGKPQFYRIAAKLLTGEGMLSYVLVPATKGTNLESIRFFRGTSFRMSEIDAISTLITDLEEELGKSAVQSGQVYDPMILEKLGPIPIEAGHSLGSTMVQHRLAEHNGVCKAYLYNGPGVSMETVQRFNDRMRASEHPIDLIIRDTNTDPLSPLGQAHIGYQAPPDKVRIDFLKYHPPYATSAGHAHVFVWPRLRAKYYGLEGGFSQADIDAHCDRRTLIPLEWFRETAGPPVANAIRAIRDLYRSLVPSRIINERGLHIQQAGQPVQHIVV
jgi:hypothetical protein